MEVRSSASSAGSAYLSSNESSVVMPAHRHGVNMLLLPSSVRTTSYQHTMKKEVKCKKRSSLTLSARARTSQDQGSWKEEKKKKNMEG